MDEHECLFPEEQEPEGRLILGPCLTCDLPAIEALDQVKSNLRIADQTIANLKFLAEQNDLAGIQAVFREPSHLRAVPE